MAKITWTAEFKSRKIGKKWFLVKEKDGVVFWTPLGRQLSRATKNFRDGRTIYHEHSGVTVKCRDGVVYEY
jgi:hypothetical protein